MNKNTKTMSYHKNQLDRINLDSDYKPSIKLFDGEGNSTNQMDINIESAPIIAEWLEDNFIEGQTPKVARYFVLQHGSDCDGFSKFGLSCFSSKEAAENCLESRLEGSDGMLFELTSDWERIVEYCQEWERNPIEETVILDD